MPLYLWQYLVGSAFTRIVTARAGRLIGLYFKYNRIVALGRAFDMEPGFTPVPRTGRIKAKDIYTPDDAMKVGLSGGILSAKRSDAVVPVLAALKSSGIQISFCSGKAKIFGGKILLDAVRKLSFHNLCRPLPVCPVNV